MFVMLMDVMCSHEEESPKSSAEVIPSVIIFAQKRKEVGKWLNLGALGN